MPCIELPKAEAVEAGSGVKNGTGAGDLSAGQTTGCVREIIWPVRKALPEDLEDMAELFRETVAGINSRDYNSEQIGAWLGKASPERWDELWNSGAASHRLCWKRRSHIQKVAERERWFPR